MATRSRIIIGGLAAVAAVGLSAGSALAAGPGTSRPTTGVSGDAKAPPSLAAIQARAAKAVEARETTLAKAVARVQQTAWLGADQAALLATLQADEAKLQALGQKIAGDTEVATAKADYQDIFSQYRVYLLVAPVTRIVATSDRITTQAAPHLTTAAQRLQARETTADAAQVAPLLSDLASKLQAATGAVNGLPARVMALTPAAYDADRSVLKAPEAAVRAAAADLKAATADARQAATIERQARAGHSGRHGGAGPVTP